MSLLLCLLPGKERREGGKEGKRKEGGKEGKKKRGGKEFIFLKRYLQSVSLYNSSKPFFDGNKKY